MAVLTNTYSPRMAIWNRRPVVAPPPAPDFKDYFDAAVGAVSDRLTATETAISTRLDQSDKAGAEQHARIEARMGGIETGLAKMGERVGTLEQQREREVGIEAGKQQIMVPWVRGVVMPLLVILIALIVGAGITALVVKASQSVEEPTAVVTGKTCKEQVATLVASRDSYTRQQYQDVAQQLADQGCAVTAALTCTP